MGNMLWKIGSIWTVEKRLSLHYGELKKGERRLLYKEIETELKKDVWQSLSLSANYASSETIQRNQKKEMRNKRDTKIFIFWLHSQGQAKIPSRFSSSKIPALLLLSLLRDISPVPFNFESLTMQNNMN